MNFILENIEIDFKNYFALLCHCHPWWESKQWTYTKEKSARPLTLLIKDSGPEEPKGQGGHPPQILSDQVTLFQPGGQIMPTTFYLPPGFSDLPPALKSIVEDRIEWEKGVIRDHNGLLNRKNNVKTRHTYLEYRKIFKGSYLYYVSNRTWWVGS